MKHGEKINTKCLPSFMHHFSLCPSVNWSLAGFRSQSKISCIFSKISMTKIFYMKNFLLGLVKVQSTQLPPVFFAQIHGQKEFEWEKIGKYSLPYWILSCGWKV